MDAIGRGSDAPGASPHSPSLRLRCGISHPSGEGWEPVGQCFSWSLLGGGQSREATCTCLTSGRGPAAHPGDLRNSSLCWLCSAHLPPGSREHLPKPLPTQQVPVKPLSGRKCGDTQAGTAGPSEEARAVAQVKMIKDPCKTLTSRPSTGEGVGKVVGGRMERSQRPI